MPEPPGTRPVCVLSVGRSGTSLLARILSILGVDLGPEESMLEPNDWNPEGFWEQRAIMDLNDDILTALGGSFFEPPPRPPGWERAPSMAPFRRRAQAIVEECFAHSPRWGFKDPRSVFTLPLWREVVGEMDFIIALRDPGEVVASFRAGRPQMEPEDVDELWLEANAAALSLSEGARRLVVSFDEWFERPEAVTARLAGFLGVDDDSVAERMPQIGGAISHGLKRRRDDESRRPVEVRALDLLLRQLGADAADGPDGAAAVAAGLHEAFVERRRLRAEHVRLADRLRRLEGEVEHVHDRLAEAEAERRRQADRERALAAGTADLEARLERLTAEHARQRRVLDEVFGSASWRLTAPLRGVKRRLAR